MTDDLAEVRRREGLIDQAIEAACYALPPGKRGWNAYDYALAEAAARKMFELTCLDREGQTVEGGDDWEAKFKAHTEAVQGFLAEMIAVYDPCASGEMPVREVCAFLVKQATDDRQRFYDQEAELTRLKAAQVEHDRTVRLAALEEVRNVMCDYCANGVEFTGRWHVWQTRNAADITAGCKAQPIRSLIDQTGGEGGV